MRWAGSYFPSCAVRWHHPAIGSWRGLGSWLPIAVFSRRCFLSPRMSWSSSSALNQRGEIVAEILTDDKELQATIHSHPGLLWKALNVRKHHGLIGTEEE